MEEAGLKEPEDLIVFNQNLVSDDEASEDEDETRQSSRESMNVEEVELSSKQDGQTSQQCEFNLDGPEGTETVRTPTIIDDEEDSPKLESVAAEFLKKHHCLNPLSMAKMQVMAKQGILSKRWAKCDIPMCTSCLSGKATRRPWRTKPKKDSQESKLRTATEPGQCIGVDQLDSRTPGLIAQVKGWLTKKRYQAATIFVDHSVHYHMSTCRNQQMQKRLWQQRFRLNDSRKGMESKFKRIRRTTEDSRRRLSCKRSRTPDKR
jgi:hypothetical protein